MFLLLGSTWNDIGLIGQRLPARFNPPVVSVRARIISQSKRISPKRFQKKNKNKKASPELPISKRFARATGVGLGEREMHLRRDAPATKSSGYPRPQAEPRRGRKRLRRQVPRRVTRGALRSKVARGCARTAKNIHRPKVAAVGSR